MVTLFNYNLQGNPFHNNVLGGARVIVGKDKGHRLSWGEFGTQSVQGVSPCIMNKFSSRNHFLSFDYLDV